MKLLSTAAAVMAFDHSCAFQTLVPPATAKIGAPRSSAHPVRSSPWAVSSIRRRGAAVSPVLCAAQTSDITATAGSAEAKRKEGGQHGHGSGKAKPPKTDKNSFVQWDMRRAAMKLHTRDQSPKEGKQENKGTAFSDWKPTRRGYLQFLVDSEVVYSALEEACASDARLADFRDTGLERTTALASDIAWMLETYADIASAEGGGPVPTKTATEYASFLRETRASSLPAFMCHYYNHYFAHTAGGRMIGRKVADSCLEGRTLEFYKWEGGDVKELLDQVRQKIDAMAKGWSIDDKEACVAETARTFQYGGALLSSITSSD